MIIKLLKSILATIGTVLVMLLGAWLLTLATVKMLAFMLGVFFLGLILWMWYGYFDMGEF
jgi:hypothetical protein